MINSIIHNFEGVRRSANGFLARCPAHEDKVQSLSIKDDGRKILLNCFAGCDIHQILKAAGLELKQLFHDNDQLQPKRQPNPFDGSNVVTSAKKEVAVYQYRDESGNVLYENVRYEPKEFRQRRFDAGGNPILNLNGVRRVPYRLPELLPCNRLRDDVWLCEGEKDADALAKLGFTASSFKNWRPEFNTYIKDSHVIIVMDHDKPGEKQANKAARLIAPAVKSVKVLDVFADRPMPDKNGLDVSDYLYQCVREEDMGPVEKAERLCIMAGYCDEWTDHVIPQRNLFQVKTANGWLQEAKHTPAPKMLFGEFWYEGELCILFADTNVGKSILAVQIANAISKGSSFIVPASSASDAAVLKHEASEATILAAECGPQKVLYFDFELNAKQFESRFAERDPVSGHFVNHYEFDQNFLRASFDPDNTDYSGFESYEAYLNFSLDAMVKENGVRILIIDNLTYLRDETENAKNAMPLMKYLKELKSNHDLSILALAHTPKRDSSKILTRNDLQGSKMLINFCDSSFAIGESMKTPGLKYIKQIKERNTPKIYGSDNVILGKIEKNTNFIGFEFIGFGSEFEHLKEPDESHRQSKIDHVKQLAAEGKTQREIAEELSLSRATVHRYSRA